MARVTAELGSPGRPRLAGLLFRDSRQAQRRRRQPVTEE